MKELLIRAERCLGCRSCELACAVAHSTSQNLLASLTEEPRPQYRVHVAGDGRRALPLQCRNCEDAPCLSACLTGALRRDARGVVVCSSDLCIGCWMCIMVCPFGIITQSHHQRRIVKCDRCPDREIPACVTACPTRALRYREVDRETAEKRREVLDNLKIPTSR
ncbi:MAG: 4Fe-4S dicluster domain-containing protein [Deltaproteobacteria bacterium]|nr:4Fe-4S dicluster domain-containing protein [Deltaproteobacteria bacterium]